ncbi:hypothetical protein [Pseudokineococcus sp. 1T1Z-3]|uniref:hypothetical protein n=1 Tax=Pseudokineococcus sp. 1T1Z-3 TaxID=3132745 RepID=UPI0030B5D22D
MTTDRELDAALRSLDRAATADDGTRAAADLHRILTTTPSSCPGDRAAAPGRPHARTTRRVVLAGGVVAAATAGLLVLPSALGEGSAFASWTATPDVLGAEESAVAVAHCREVFAGTSSGAGAVDQVGDVAGADLALALAERRGTWTNVVLTGPDGLLASCLSTEPREESYSAGASAGGRVPGPAEVTIRSFGTTTQEVGDQSELTGLAGEDVTDVTYRSREHGDVEATVAGGVWSLWFPGDELEDTTAPEGIDVRVGYRDGSTATVTLLGECNRGMADQRC